jgi:hypothetical protein
VTKGHFSIGPGVSCNLDRLVNTRLLVQANSGAGKSWALRRILEQTHGKIQQLVIDPEGEFASLREQFDYVLASRQGGDTLADPRTAKLLAERLLELGVSAILDIYELKPHERVKFVRTFLETLVEAPKNLWHPVLVLLDEAHVYAPEQGDAESADAVKSLATRGRKRGFCLIAATQRLSKLHKDVAAECNNKLIGRSSLDVDMKRAGAELGFTTKEQQLSLRDLDDGEFYAFGPALTKTVTKVKVGSVQTTHPKAGSRLAAVVPPPTDKVKALLPKLSDLPAEAEAREKTVADLKRELATARRDLTEARKAQPPAPKVDEAKAAKVLELKRSLAAQQRALDAAMKILVKIKAVDFPIETDDDRKALEQAIAGAVRQVTGPIEKRITALIGRVEGLKSSAVAAEKAIAALLEEKIDLGVQVQRREPFAVVTKPTPRPTRPVSEPPTNGSYVPGKGGDGRMLAALAQFPEGLTDSKLAILSGMTKRGGAFRTYLSKLRVNGLVTGDRGRLRITDQGVDAAGEVEPLPTGPELLDYWRRELGDSGARKIFDVLVEKYPQALLKHEVAAGADMEVAGGAFRTYVSKLRVMGLIEGSGELRASEELFS